MEEPKAITIDRTSLTSPLCILIKGTHFLRGNPKGTHTELKGNPATGIIPNIYNYSYATCCTQRCCDILCWSFAMVWPELANLGRTMLRYVVLICCDRVAGGLAKWMFSSSLLWFTGLWVFFVIGRCDYLGFSSTTLKWIIGVTATKFRLNHVFKIKRSLTRFVTYL